MTSSKAIIASGSGETSEAGAHALREGGNAVDGLCAAAMAAFVVEGLLCSPLGGGAALIYGKDSGAELLDFFATTPGLGGETSPESLDFAAVEVDFGPTVQTFHAGRASAAMSHALSGVLELHERRGSLPLHVILEPALHYARDGFATGGPMAYVADILAPILRLTPQTAELFLLGGAAPQPGAVMRNPKLGDLFDRLGRERPSGVLAELSRALVRTFGHAQGGLLTSADVKRYRPRWRTPLSFDLGDRTFVTNAPPSSGGALVGLGARAARTTPAATAPFLGPKQVVGMARLLESLDRARTGGVDRLLEDDADALASSEWPNKIRQGVIDALGTDPLGSTTHISVLDREGNVASLTMSNGEGSGYTLAEYGVHVNNFLGEEDINPRGFHALAPGTAMTTMMAPSVVLEQRAPSLVFGSGGSNRIRSALLQTLIAHEFHGTPLSQAVEAPRLHIEGSRLWFEATGMPPQSRDALLERWPDATVFDSPNLYFGGVHAIAREPASMVGCGDPRRGGVALEVSF